MGANDGRRINTETFEPFSEADANKMTKEQKKMCKNLSSEQKALIKTRQAQVFTHGRALMVLMAGPLFDSVSASCRADPMACLELIEAGVR